MSDHNAETVTLAGWVARVREKFDLISNTRPDEPEYWRGYAACLDDVERFARTHFDSSAGAIAGGIATGGGQTAQCVENPREGLASNSPARPERTEP